MKSRLMLAVAVTLVNSATMDGLIIKGEGPKHRAAPPDGAPWNEVAQIGKGKGTGVYLGNGFVLTAGHVAPNSPVVLRGVPHEIDPAFGKEGAREIASTDLKLLRMAGKAPAGGATLIGEDDEDLRQPCTIIAWGVGKGVPIPGGGGWEWGGDDTARQRWGTNVTNATLKLLPEGAPMPQFTLITTSFDEEAGPDETQIAGQDSGAALFIRARGIWKLAGTGSDVTTMGKALFDNDPAKPGRQPDQSLFVRVKTHRKEILQVTGEAGK